MYARSLLRGEGRREKRKAGRCKRLQQDERIIILDRVVVLAKLSLLLYHSPPESG